MNLLTACFFVSSSFSAAFNVTVPFIRYLITFFCFVFSEGIFGIRMVLRVVTKVGPEATQMTTLSCNLHYQTSGSRTHDFGCIRSISIQG